MTKIERLEQKLEEAKKTYDTADYEMRCFQKQGLYAYLHATSGKRIRATQRIKKLEAEIIQAKIEALQKLKDKEFKKSLKLINNTDNQLDYHLE